MTLQEKQAKRQKLAAEIRSKADEFMAAANKWRDGEEDNWKKLNEEYDAIMAEIEDEDRSKKIADRLAEIESQSRQSANTRGIGRDDAGREPGQRRQGQDGAQTVTEQTRKAAFNAAVRQMAGIKINREGREAMKLCGYRGQKKLLMPFDETEQMQHLAEIARSANSRSERISGLRREMRAMESIALAKGGILVPQTLMRMIEVNMLYFGPMLVTSDTIVTGDGGNLTWPTFDDTTNTASQVGENPASATDANDASLGGLQLGAFKQTSGVLKVSEELMQDAAIDLVPIIAEALGQRLGRRENTLLTTGNGGNTVQGIVGAAGLGATTSGQAITFDKLIELKHSVDVAYRNSPGVGWMMHDTIMSVVRLLRDSDSSLLWKGGANFDTVDRIEGMPVFVNNDMDSAVTTGKKAVLFGDLSKYKIRRAGGLRFYRMDERYRDTDQTGFVAFTRLDGGLLNAGTNPVKHLLIG
jgi:HK97 family phage major capsid protein